jgi:hypothetical protein
MTSGARTAARHAWLELLQQSRLPTGYGPLGYRPCRSKSEPCCGTASPT